MRPSLFIFSCLFSVVLTAQSFFDAVYRPGVGEVAEATLAYPVDSMLELSRNEQPALLSIVGSTGDNILLNAEVSVRGKFRRNRCSAPPLKLDFDKGELKDAGYSKHDKYKVVLPCYDAPDADNLLLKEYLAYKIYAQLSPDAHFRVQLLRLTQRDINGTNAATTGYAFLIEDTDQMAKRTGGKEIDDAIALPSADFDPDAEATHALLQYLIGNGDWSLHLNRNIKVVQRADSSYVPVGYDFDFSGWVGAPYASPSSEIGQESIYKRVYLGLSQPEAVLRRANQRFRENRRELLATIDGFTLLPEDERTTLRRFAQRFFSTIAEMSGNTTVLLYDQLRGASAEIIPPGGESRHYGIPAGSARK